VQPEIAFWSDLSGIWRLGGFDPIAASYEQAKITFPIRSPKGRAPFFGNLVIQVLGMISIGLGVMVLRKPTFKDA
jgi:hypothetical protein